MFVAQKAGVTVVDLSGRFIRRICPLVAPSDDAGRGAEFPIRGIGGGPGLVYLASGNRVAVCEKGTGRVVSVAELAEVSEARG